jgi:hypothetical protein
MAAMPFANAGAGAAAPGAPQDYAKLFKAERDNLELAEGLYAWAADGAEARVLRRFGRLPA